MTPFPLSMSRARARPIAPILQDEVAECGLACVAMLAGAFGVEVSLAALRRRHPAPTAGSSLWDLRERLAELGIDAHPVEFDPEALNELPLPAIVHFGAHHFVVIADRVGGWVRVLNPASGEALVPSAGLRERLSGRALIADPSQPRGASREADSPSSVGATDRCAPPSAALAPDRLARPHLRRLLPLSLAAGALGLLVPMALSRVLDVQVLDLGTPIPMALAVLACVLASAAADGLLGLTQLRAGQAIERRVMPALIARLMRKRPAFFEKRELADLHQRVSAFVPTAAGRPALITAVRTAALTGAVSLALMAWLHPWLATLGLAGIGLMGLVSLHFEPRRAALKLAAEEAAAARNDFVFETLRGVSAIRAAGLQHRRAEAFMGVLGRVQQVARQIGSSELRQQALYQVIARAESVVLLLVGLHLLARGALTMGQLLIFSLLKDIALGAATTLFQARVSARENQVVEDRAALLIDAEEEPVHTGGSPARLDRELALDGLRVDRPDGGPLITAATLTLRRGEKVALIGPSGCGKSSLLRVLGGDVLAAAGVLRVDGREIDGPALRGVAFLQDVRGVLFQGSVRDNVLLFGAHAAAPSTLDDLADRLGLADLIRDLPHGWSTRITEGAPLMSSGQRQRLLVARALCAPQPLLLLDEPTANLDPVAASATLDTLLSSDKTLLVVLHDRAQASRFDRVLCIEDGTLVEWAPGRTSRDPIALVGSAS